MEDSKDGRDLDPARPDVAKSSFTARIEEVRRFNRFYTRQIGVLNEGLLGSRWSLAEVRVLYEIAHLESPTASEIARGLGLDAGYMSRIVRAFEQQGLIEKRPSEADGRQSLLRLSREGDEVFAQLNTQAQKEVGLWLTRLCEAGQVRLADAMRTILALLDPRAEPQTPYLLRPHQPGDMGWVVHRHGVLYAQEYGYDETFEALVAAIVARFIQRFDSRRERCWIAERDGENVGSVFLVKKTRTVAKLRLLLVEPKARGLGIGKRLVEECLRAARQMGYKKITLWTHGHLYAARNIYRKAGFRKVHEEHSHSFGRDLVDEIWDLKL